MPQQIKITIDDSKLVEMIKATAGQRPIRIVADGVEYGIYQELGPSEGGKRQWGFKPFMKPSVESARPGFLKAWQQVNNLSQAEAVVEKAARDVERGAKINAPVDTGALRSSIHVVDAELFEVEFTPERELRPFERTRFG